MNVRRVVNLLPHDITVDTDSGVRLEWERDSSPLRLQYESFPLPPLDVRGQTVPVVEHALEEHALERAGSRIVSLSQAGQLVIVSGMVLDALSPIWQHEALQRCAAPDTGPESAIRDENGEIVAVRRLRMRKPFKDTR